MHGIVHKSLKDHVEENVEGIDWDTVMDRAGIEPKLYLPVSHYADEEVSAAFEVLSEHTGASTAALQREFGRYLGPDLLDTFKAHVRNDWGTRDLLLSLELVTEAITAQNDETAPPDVHCEPDGDAVSVTYRSERELCALGKGIVDGVADHFGDEVELSESACMREGDDRCELTIDFV